MSIYITGDTHGERNHYLHMRENPAWTEEDVVLIAGDWGFLNRNDEEANAFLDLLETRPYTMCFVDGNHDNHALLNSLPVEVWNGGKVHRIRKNIFHLMRGQVFTIQGKKLFTFGGAYSIDAAYQRLHNNWWKDEIPSDVEYKEAAANLAAHGNQVDYILTHTAPQKIIRRMGYIEDPHDAELTGFFAYVMCATQYTHWYFGHWHEDRQVTDKFTAVWYDTYKCPTE